MADKKEIEIYEELANHLEESILNLNKTSGIDTPDAIKIKDQNAYCWGTVSAYRTSLEIMGHEIRMPLFIDEDDYRSVPYYFIDNTRIECKPLEEQIVEVYVDEEEPEKTRKVDRHGKKTDKKSAYLKLYSDLYPDYAVDKKTKYDKTMNEIMSDIFTPSERKYLVLRYGLDGNGKRFFREISDIDGNTSESTVRHVINKMLDELRADEIISRLQDTLIRVTPEPIKEDKPPKQEEIYAEITDIVDDIPEKNNTGSVASPESQVEDKEDVDKTNKAVSKTDDVEETIVTEEVEEAEVEDDIENLLDNNSEKKEDDEEIIVIGEDDDDEEPSFLNAPDEDEDNNAFEDLWK